jgi:L-ascorbate metabolism protein UlaG (beta-lactamase superfamily)
VDRLLCASAAGAPPHAPDRFPDHAIAGSPDAVPPRGPGAEPPHVTVTYLGHASLVIESGGESLVTDPVFSDRIGRFFTKRTAPSTFRAEGLGPVVGILISHGHHDHLDYRSLRRVGDGPPILVPWGLAPHLRLHGFADVRTVRPWESIRLGAWRIVAVPARHFGGRLPFVHTSGYQGYVLTGPASIYFAGDTGFDGALFQEIAGRFHLDLAILPIAGAVFPGHRRNHMNASDALAAFGLLGAGRMLPMHFETFPASFEPADRPRSQLERDAVRLGIRDRVTILAEGASLYVPGTSAAQERPPTPQSSAPPSRVPERLAGRGDTGVE